MSAEPHEQLPLTIGLAGVLRVALEKVRRGGWVGKALKGVGGAHSSKASPMSARWVLVALVLGCAPRAVSRLDDATPVDLSGYWNDTDSRLVTEELVSDAAARPWLAEFTAARGRPPVVLFDGISNRSAEDIPQETFLNAIQRALLNDGRIRFVAAPAARARLRAERADQAGNATAATRNAVGAELGADFILGGTISYIEDQSGRTQLRVYQVDLQLLSLQDNRIVWSGSKVIRKIVGRTGVRP